VFIILMFNVVTIIRCCAKFYQSYLAEKVVQVGINKLRRDAYWHVMNMPIGYFANERPSDAVSRLIRDTGAMGNGIKILLGKALREPMNAIILLGAAAVLNWQLTLIFLCGGPVTIWFVSRLGKKMKRASKKSLMAWSEMLAKLQETMTGLKVVRFIISRSMRGAVRVDKQAAAEAAFENFEGGCGDDADTGGARDGRWFGCFDCGSELGGEQKAGGDGLFRASDSAWNGGGSCEEDQRYLEQASGGGGGGGQGVFDYG